MFKCRFITKNLAKLRAMTELTVFRQSQLTVQPLAGGVIPKQSA